MSFIELCKGGRLDEAKALFENVEMLELYSRYGRQQCLVDGQALKCQAEVEEIFHTVKNLRGELSAELEIIHHLEEWNKSWAASFAIAIDLGSDP